MNTYELTVVLAGSMTEAKRSAVVDKIKKAVADSGGSVTKADEWGKRELAYKIKHEKEGFYYFFELTLPPDRPGGVNRMIGNDEQVLRHLLVRAQDKGQSAQEKTKKVAESPERAPDRGRGIDKREKKGKIGKGKKVK